MNNLENSVKVLHVRNQKRADSIKKLDKRIDDCKSEDKALYDKITSLEDKIAKLEKNQNYKKLWEENTKDYNELARKRLDDYCKIEKLDKKIDEQRKELNGIYKVMEMNADDIQTLQDNMRYWVKQKPSVNSKTRDNNNNELK